MFVPFYHSRTHEVIWVNPSQISLIMKEADKKHPGTNIFFAGSDEDYVTVIGTPQDVQAWINNENVKAAAQGDFINLEVHIPKSLMPPEPKE